MVFSMCGILHIMVLLVARLCYLHFITIDSFDILNCLYAIYIVTKVSAKSCGLRCWISGNGQNRERPRLYHRSLQCLMPSMTFLPNRRQPDYHHLAKQETMDTMCDLSCSMPTRLAAAELD